MYHEKKTSQDDGNVSDATWGSLGLPNQSLGKPCLARHGSSDISSVAKLFQLECHTDIEGILLKL